MARLLILYGAPQAPWDPASPGGFLAEYRFDEGSGTTVLDYSGNGNDGTVGGTGGSLGPYGLTAVTAGGWLNVPVALSTVKTAVFHFAPAGTGSGALLNSQTAGTDSPSFKMVNSGAEGQTQWRIDREAAFAINTATEMSSAGWPFTVAATINGSVCTISVNGVPAGVYDTLDPAVTFTTSGNVRLFGNSAGQGFPGLLCYALLYSVVLTEDQLGRAAGYCRTKVARRAIPDTGPRTLTAPLVILTGNSLTNNEVVANIDLKRSAAILKVAIAGGTPPQIQAKVTQAAIPLYRPLAPGNIASIWPTPNATTVNEVLTAARAIGLAYQAAGFRVVLKSTLDHGNNWELIKQGIQDAYLDPTTGWVAFADFFVDFSSDANVYADGAYMDRTWYIDDVHITPLAYTTYVYTPERDAIASFLPPVADFSPSASAVTPGGSVTFTDTSVGTVTSRLWDFGDGGTSSSTNPVHTFTNAGSYNVTLTVTGPLGTSPKTVTVQASTDAAAILAVGPYTWLAAGPGFATKAGGGLPSVGDLLSAFTDRSGNGRSPTQTTGGNQPTLQTVSGQYVIRFNKARGDFFQWAAGTFDALTTGAEIFTVEQVTGGGSVQGHWLFGTAAEDYYGFGGDIYDGFASTTRHGPITPGVALTDLHLYHALSTAAAWSNDIDGTQVFTTGTNVVGWVSVAKFGVGRDDSGGDRELRALLVFRSLSGGDRATVRAALKSLYGTP